MYNLNVFRQSFFTFKYLCGIYQPSKLLKTFNNIPYSVRSLSIVHKKGEGTHKPNTLEKYLLVWMKKYPSVSEVPPTVTYEVMEKTRNWARIKINIIFCIVTAVICAFMVYSGKQAAKRGESIHKMSVDWHKEQNEKK